MRFLISTLPAAGHVHPALPVATALVDRGHQVVWHTGAEYAARVESTGAKLAPARRAPSLEELPGEPDPGSSGLAAATSALRNLLVERMPGQLADYEQILRAFPADAILVDLCSLGGAALHEWAGVPWATLGIGPLTLMSPDTPPFGSGLRPPRTWFGRAAYRLMHALTRAVMRGLTAAYAERRAAVGLPALPHGVTVFDHLVSPMLHLQAATPSLEYPRRPWPAHVHFVGPLLPPAQPAAALPSWWSDLLAAEVVVHVTQGTVATDPTTLLRPALDALADLDGLVVATTPDPAALGTLPANARVAPFVPHALLLPHVDAMVSNAGYNGVKAALAHGLPLVLAPWGNDQPDVAARVEWAGAGVNLRVRSPKPAAIAAAVRSVLREASYRRAAERIRDEFLRAGTGARAAALLETLALTRAPVLGAAFSERSEARAR